MSKDMLERATHNAKKSQITNVKFVESAITNITLPSSTTDCIISNCVINLVPKPDKYLVFKEVFRILKPCGRVAISDILAENPFPPELEQNITLYVGCIAGASMVGEYETWLKDAGFKDVMIVDKSNDLNVYKEIRFDREREEKVGGKDMRLACCGVGEAGATEKTGCGAVDACGTQLSKFTADVDFNEWVGSFNVYAVKPY